MRRGQGSPAPRAYALLVVRRSVQQLVEIAVPAWPEVVDAVAAAPAQVEVLSVERADAERALHRPQVTAASYLGAIVLNSGGLLIDHGWLRILGGGTSQLPDVAEASPMPRDEDPEPTPPPWLIVAYDVLGGRFAINGGGLTSVPLGEVA